MFTNECLRLCEDTKVQLGEIYSQESVQTSLYSMDDEVSDASFGKEKGMQIRVNIDGCVGISVIDDSNVSNVVSATRGAIKMAQALTAYHNVSDTRKTISRNPVVSRSYLKPKADPNNYSLNEKKNILKSVYERLCTRFEIIERVYCEYEEREIKEQYCNTEGSEIENIIHKIFLQALLQYRAGTNTNTISASIGGIGGLELLEGNQGIDRLVEELIDRIALSKRRRTCPSGRYTVVLSQEVTGLLVHEVLGHMLEANIATNPSFESMILERKAEGEGPTIIDNPTIPNEYGSYLCDAEGVPAQKTVLVDDGVLTSYLHSRETAAYFGTASTGNARIHSYRDLPIVRMSNTYLEPKDWTFEELVDVKEGIYITGIDFGQVLKEEGIFSLLVNNVFLIRRGEVDAVVHEDMEIAGKIDEIFRFEAIGKDFRLYPGRCWKDEQRIDVAYGAPYTRIRKLYLHSSGDFHEY